jgi:hypothetical protein
MDEGVLRLIAKAYLLLRSGSSDPGSTFPDKIQQTKRQSPHGHLANNGKLNRDRNQQERESER